MLLAAAGLLAACQTRLPPLPAAELRSSAPLGTDALAAADTPARDWPAQRWWQRFGDPTLDALVERALRLSPTLGAAAARQARARAALQLQAAASGVSIDAHAQQQRQRISDNGLFPPEFLGFNWYSMSDLGLDIDYRPDFWHRQSEALRAAGASAQAAQSEQAQLRVAVAAQVTQLYYAVRADLLSRELAAQSAALAGRQRDLAAARQAAELGSGDEVRRLNLQLLEAQDTVGLQQSNLELHRSALAVLLDETPAQLPPMTAAPPPAPPLELPADASLALVARRGDLSAARWRVESSHASAAVARKGYLPDLSLRAMLGLSSRELGKLLSAGSEAPVFTLAMSLPLYDAGARRARFGIARAELDAAVADYNAMLLTAAREVNDALALRTAAVIKLRNAAAAVDEATELRANADRQLQRGLTDARPLLAAEQQLLGQRAGQLQTQRQLIDADLALIRALGGGYEEAHRE